MFLTIDDRLYFSFFQGGINPVDFEPLGLFRMEMQDVGVWTEPQLYGHQVRRVTVNLKTKQSFMFPG